MADVDIDLKDVARRIGVVASRSLIPEMTRNVAANMLAFVQDHLDQMASTRHKVADRLGATYTRFLEFASGRVAGSETGQTTEITQMDADSATISIRNTPGLTRAYHDLDITPKKRKSLTIPIDKISYGKRVADLRAKEGRRVFRLGKTNLLAVSDETGRDGVRPVYALVKHVRIPRDPGLLPTRAQLVAKGRDEITDFMESAALLAD